MKTYDKYTDIPWVYRVQIDRLRLPMGKAIPLSKEGKAKLYALYVSGMKVYGWGCVIIGNTKMWSRPYFVKDMRLLSIFVHPDHRKEGIGSAIAKNILSRTDETLLYRAKNKEAMLFYSNLGYKNLRPWRGRMTQKMREVKEAFADYEQSPCAKKLRRLAFRYQMGWIELDEFDEEAHRIVQEAIKSQ